MGLFGLVFVCFFLGVQGGSSQLVFALLVCALFLGPLDFYCLIAQPKTRQDKHTHTRGREAQKEFDVKKERVTPGGAKQANRSG